VGRWFVGNTTSIKEIILGENVTSISINAFNGCSNLTAITSKATTPPTIGGSNTFNGVDKSIPVYVPASAVEAYKAAEYWKEFTNIIGMTITTPTESFVVKIGSAGYATLYLYYAVECPRGVEAYYIIRVAGNVAVLKAIWGYIPANTGVILRGTAGTYTFVATSESVAAISENLLQGTTEDKEIRAQKNTTYYALGRVDGVVGLYRAELEDGYFFNNANKAYLALTSEAEGDDDSEQFSRGFTLRFPDGSTTSMDEVMDCDASEVEVIYDLQGRRLT
jgi:hypothetical protein